MHRILIINPGSTSTKLGLWEEGKGLILEDNIVHPQEDLTPFESINEQLQYRIDCTINFLEEKGYSKDKITALAARGGLLKPLQGGTYEVNKTMVQDLIDGVQGEHASNLAALMAWEIGRENDLPSFVTDPVSVDEFEEEARYSGIPEINRRSLGHALNIKATARRAAEEFGKHLENLNFVVAHLGGGISIAALKKGRIIDVNNANEMGPYSPERTGGLPVGDLVKMAWSGDYTLKELKTKITRRGGLLGYLKTNDGREIEHRIAQGDQKAKLIYDGMIYQIGKEIGATGAVLAGDIDAVLITGGIAHSRYIVDGLTEMVSYLGPIKTYPGSMEMEALALGAQRVLKGHEKAKIYE